MIADMFRRKKEKIYASLLNVEDDARQIRSLQNVVLATNQAGARLFGLQENPFFFLRDSLESVQIQRLVDAYCHQQAWEAQIRVGKSVYQIQLKKLSDGMLLVAKDITSFVAVHTSLSHQLALLSGILSTLSDPLYLIDAKGTLIYVNMAFCRLVGASFKQILGQSLNKFIVENQPDIGGFFEGLCLIKTTDKLTTFTVRQQPLDTDLDPLFCGIIRPYSPQVEAAHFSLFEQAPLPCLIVDLLDKTVLKVNNVFCILFKQVKEEIEGKNILSFFPENMQQILLRKLDKMVQGQSESEMVELITLPMLDTRTLNIFMGFATDKKDTLLFYIVDVSARKNLEAQVAHSQKMQAIGQLAGGIAHDFNNLLTAIIGFTDLLLQNKTADDPSFLDLMQIKGNANKAAGLVGQLLTFSRKQPVRPKLISIHDAFIDLEALLQRSLLVPFNTLKLEFKRHLGCVKLDPNQLTQIFLNLAVNAKDAMPNGGIFRLSAVRERIKKSRPCGIDKMTPGDYIKITASDTGVGIDSKDLPHIFEPFFTTKESSTASGTGLGLSTVYGVVRGADGYIAVDSEKGVGTTFSIYLPRFEPDAAPLPVEKVVENDIPNTEHQIILLVDDERSVRLVSARALQSQGYHIIECDSAQSALLELQKKQEIDLLLTDMMMPGMDGETLIEEALKLRPHLKSILISGYSEEFRRHGSEENKAFTFLAKPFELSELLEKVQKVLEKPS